MAKRTTTTTKKSRTFTLKHINKLNDFLVMLKHAIFLFVFFFWICHFDLARGKNWSLLMDTYQINFHIIYCDNDLPISHTSPVHSGGHSQRNPPTRSIHVPPCSQGPPEHSSISTFISFCFFFFIVEMKKKKTEKTQHYKINRKSYSVHPMTWDCNKNVFFFFCYPIHFLSSNSI